MAAAATPPAGPAPMTTTSQDFVVKAEVCAASSDSGRGVLMGLFHDKRNRSGNTRRHAAPVRPAWRCQRHASAGRKAAATDTGHRRARCATG